jgi:photosystem II stability/assembly factor-like uncharacterized protein
MRNNIQCHVLFCIVLVEMTVNVSAQTWTSQTLPNTQTMRSIYFINSNEGWAAGYDGIIHTTNSGLNWSSQISNYPERLLRIRFVGANYGWANTGHKVLRTVNGGVTWSTQTSGVTTTLWSVIYVGSSPGFIAGGDLSISGNGTILRTDNTLNAQWMSELPTATLNQNFPNPFNRSTEISFYVPHNGIVSLKVYDVLGRQVAALVDEQLQTGNYTTTFDASGLQNGMYFYRLQTMGFNQTRKLFLQK